MAFRLEWTPEATANLADLERDQAKLRKVRKALGLLEQDPRYPGLNSHKYESMTGPKREDAWESYVENKTPAAYRLFWCYGPGAGTLTIIAITPHP